MDKMQYVEAVSQEEPKYPITLFLAGGITGCEWWQNQILEMLKDLPITIYNPRRENFPIEDPNAANEQITWEFHKLNESSDILFWFCKETMCPIVLYELGRHLARGEAIISIGMDAEYSRRQDVEIQSSLVLPNLEFNYSLEDLAKDVRTKIEGRINW